MQKNRLSYFFLTLSCVSLLFFQKAYADNSISLAAASSNLIGPMSFFTATVYKMCYVIAITLLVASIAQYRSYRQSPNQTPISRPIIILILAILVALVPIIAQLSESASYIGTT